MKVSTATYKLINTILETTTGGFPSVSEYVYNDIFTWDEINTIVKESVTPKQAAFNIYIEVAIIDTVNNMVDCKYNNVEPLLEHISKKLLPDFNKLTGKCLSLRRE